ncbi:MAG: DUF2127 domain-containing protein [Desulfurococcales archaeon]|nr:DUF2127 domain-containing protein [Desulfurococcales archaeon]
MSSEYSSEPMQPSSVEVSSRPERPLGVTILAVLSGIGGILSILGGLALGAMAGAGGLAGMEGMEGLGPLMAFGSTMAIIMGLINLVIAYGLWNGKSWAWWLTVVFAALNALMSLVSMMIVSLVIAAVIIWYMLRPHVKAFFNIS